jgi:hypothetical protein
MFLTIIFDVNSSVGLLHHVAVASFAENSEVHDVSIHRIHVVSLLT